MSIKQLAREIAEAFLPEGYFGKRQLEDRDWIMARILPPLPAQQPVGEAPGPIQCDHCGEYTLLCHGSAHQQNEDSLRAAAESCDAVAFEPTAEAQIAAYMGALRPHWPVDRSGELVEALESCLSGTYTMSGSGSPANQMVRALSAILAEYKKGGE